MPTAFTLSGAIHEYSIYIYNTITQLYRYATVDVGSLVCQWCLSRRLQRQPHLGVCSVRPVIYIYIYATAVDILLLYYAVVVAAQTILNFCHFGEQTLLHLLQFVAFRQCAVYERSTRANTLTPHIEHHRQCSSMLDCDAFVCHAILCNNVWSHF